MKFGPASKTAFWIHIGCIITVGLLLAYELFGIGTSSSGAPAIRKVSFGVLIAQLASALAVSMARRSASKFPNPRWGFQAVHITETVVRFSDGLSPISEEGCGLD